MLAIVNSCTLMLNLYEIEVEVMPVDYLIEYCRTP